MFALFMTLKKFNLLRVSEKAELEGLDLYKHNEHAYPEIVELALKVSELSEDLHTQRGGNMRQQQSQESNSIYEKEKGKEKEKRKKKRKKKKSLLYKTETILNKIYSS